MPSEVSLQSQAYQKLRNAIIFAKYKPGEKLMVRDLCDELEMGRTPVRESLVRLSQEGLIRTVPQSGTYVSKINLHSVECSRFVREHLEREITVECCARIDTEGSKRLAEIMRQHDEAVAANDHRRFYLMDNLFHKTLYQIAGREEVWTWLEYINTDLERYRWLRVVTEELDWNRTSDEHHSLFNAITERNPNEASYITALHMHMYFDDRAKVIKRYPDYFEFGTREFDGEDG